MSGRWRSYAGWRLAAAAAVLVAIFALDGGLAGSAAPPFAPGTHVEGSHSDALLILRNNGTGAGLRAYSPGGGSGLVADSDKDDGVVGRTNVKDKAGLYGFSKSGVGVVGRSDGNDGVVGVTGAKDKSGVWGHSVPGVGVTGASTQSDGVVGWTLSSSKSGVFGRSSDGIGITAQSTNGTALVVDGTSVFKKYASFEGGHGDLAENYHADGDLEAGDVAVISPSREMALRIAGAANDTSVAGIVSTMPSMRLSGRIDDKQSVPLVIAGRTLCKVDGRYGAIRPGDLLTSSPTPGHAMKSRPVLVGSVEIYRPGTIIGKALEGWTGGKGQIAVLVMLH
jgi:hypothetical protein